jgi:hypothetical protein
MLLQAVKRNARRFPADFMMRLTAAKWAIAAILSACRELMNPPHQSGEALASPPISRSRSELDAAFPVAARLAPMNSFPSISSAVPGSRRVMSGKPTEEYLGSWLPDGFY